MRSVFKEIFTRYIEEREEINNGGNEEDNKTPDVRTYSRPQQSKGNTGTPKNSSAPGSAGDEQSNNQAQSLVSSSLPSTNRSENFTASGHQQHSGAIFGHSQNHHRGAGGRGGRNDLRNRGTKARTPKRRKK